MTHTMSRRLRLTLAAIAATLHAALPAAAQNAWDHTLGLDASPGLTLHTSPYFSGTNPQGHSFGPMIQGTLRWTAAATGQGARIWPGLRMGVGLKALSLLRPSLTGTPAGIFVFQGADISRPAPRLALAYEWQFGATAPWQIMDAAHPDQAVNGSPVCAMLGASLLLRYDISPSWSLTAGIDLAHYSNGNTRWPNAGTNTAGLRIGLAHLIGRSSRAPRLSPTDTAALGSTGRWHTDILVFGAWRKKCYHDPDDLPLPLPGHFGVAGINISPSRRLSRRVSAGPSLDLVYDESAVPESHIIGGDDGTQPYYIRPGFMKQTAAGISAQAEYAMPVFSLHVALGYNLLAGCRELRYFYQTLALRTFVTPRVWLNVGYSLRNFAHPRHLMLGIGLRLGGSGSGSPMPLSRL